MSKNPKRSREGERGQALVEFALILPVILLVMVGMLEFARAWNLHQVMTDAAREGARRAAIQDVGLGHEQTQDSVYAAADEVLAGQRVGELDALATVRAPSRFELSESLSGHHHHHLTCTVCGKVDDITPTATFEQAMAAESAAVAARSGAVITGHSVDLYGRCPDCATPASH